jgi:hypothetical protein
VGVATASAFGWWFLLADAGPHASAWQLTHWGMCGPDATLPSAASAAVSAIADAGGAAARAGVAVGGESVAGGGGGVGSFAGVDCAAFSSERPRAVALSTLVLIEVCLPGHGT